MTNNSGVALWRQIADSLRQDIEAKALPQGSPLPPEMALAQRFGVNRHTVRAAIRALSDEGLLRAERGRGTFVMGSRRLSYRLSSRTRLSESLMGQANPPSGRVLASEIVPADEVVAAALMVAPGTPMLRLDTVTSVDGKPLSCSMHFLPADRFGTITETFVARGSLTATLAAFGVPDYVRQSTTVLARPADADEARHLELAPGSTVLVSQGIDAEPDGTRLQYVVSRFAASRVELVIGPEG